jgi:predicted ferric reductase
MRESSDALATLERLERAGDKPLDATGLADALALRDPALSRALVRACAQDGARAARPSAVRARIRALDAGTSDGRLDFVFTLFDRDGGGTISPEEFSAMIEGALAGSRLVVARGWLDAMTRAVFASADTNDDRVLSLEEFRRFVASNAGLSRLLSQPISSMLSARRREKRDVARSPLRERAAQWAYEQGAGGVAAVLAYGLVTAFAFALAALEYRARGANTWVQLARGCGRVIDVHLVLVLLFVARRTLTALRRTWLGAKIPVDDAIAAHRAVAWTMLVFSLGHAAAHCANYASRGALGTVWFASVAAATGLALLAVFFVMAFFARASVRRSGNFERFARAHKLAYVFYGLCLVHSPNVWRYIVPVLILWAIERLWRARGVVRTRALWIEPLPSGVTRLEVEAPPGWKHRAGDYVFLKIASLAKGEWHPFTISSAPETKGVFTVHVRSAGNWTSALHSLARSRASGAAPAQFSLEVDGPFGAPTSELFDAKVPVLIGAGIGVTPFAAVLESLRLRAKKGLASPDRVYFFWVLREQESFEWFAERLCAIEAEDQEARRFVLKVFVTGANVTDGSGPWLDAALATLHAKVGRDPLTGLSRRTGLGSPDWKRELSAIAEEHLLDVRVFFCGPEGLGETLSKTCAESGIRFCQEHF